MSTLFDRLARRLVAAAEAGEPEAAGGRDEEERRRRLRLILVVLALMSLPLAYAVISNVVRLTPPEGTTVVPPPTQPPVQVSVNPEPPLWGSSVVAGEWRNVTVTITNPQPGMYAKLRFVFNTTASPTWVSVLFDGNIGPDNTATIGNTVYVARYVGQSAGFVLRIRLNQPGVKLVNAELWMDTDASFP